MALKAELPTLCDTQGHLVIALPGQHMETEKVHKCSFLKAKAKCPEYLKEGMLAMAP